MTITALIPTYRRPHLLKKAISSVLQQEYRNLKVIVCDNASGDETESVVRSFQKDDPRVYYFCQPSHVGIDQNFDHALSLVDTPYYSFLCDDDFMLPNFYQLAVTALQKHPEAIFFVGSLLQVNLKGEVLHPMTLQHDGLWDIKTAPAEQMRTVVKNILVQACLFRKNGQEGRNRSHPLLAWDELIVWELLLRHPIYTSSTHVGFYGVHEGQASSIPYLEHCLYFKHERLASLLHPLSLEIQEKVKYFEDFSQRFRQAVLMASLGKKEIVGGLAHAFRRSRHWTYALATYFLWLCATVSLLRRFLSLACALYRKRKKRLLKPIQSDHSALIVEYIS